VKRILVASSKGGCGKSTVALLLALTLRHKGQKVRVEDKDPQRTLTRALQGKGGNEEVGAKFCIVDVAPRHEHLEGEIANASLTLVPIAPTMPDVWATMDWLAKMKERKGDVRLLWNRVRPGTKTSESQNLEKYAKQIGVPAMSTQLQLRANYDGALMLLGWEALAKAPPAKEEALGLLCEVLGAGV
jgi:chromosome partitioning protein